MLVLEGLDRRPVGLARGLDAPLVGAVHRVHHGGGLQQGLRGDATPEQAGAAEAVVTFDQGDALAELGGAQGGGVPARPGADHHYVVRITHPVSKSTARLVPAVGAARCPLAVPCRAMDESTEAQELKHTPLEAEHEALGAKMAPFAGWNMPIEYEGALEEHRAVRERVGLFDLTHLGKVEVTGPGALGMLQARGHQRPAQGGRRRGPLQPRPERGRRRDRGPDRLPAGRGAVLRRPERRERAAGAADAGGGAGRPTAST